MIAGSFVVKHGGSVWFGAGCGGQKMKNGHTASDPLKGFRCGRPGRSYDDPAISVGARQ
jgi:hypothetical protein